MPAVDILLLVCISRNSDVQNALLVTNRYTTKDPDRHATPPSLPTSTPSDHPSSYPDRLIWAVVALVVSPPKSKLRLASLARRLGSVPARNEKGSPTIATLHVGGRFMVRKSHITWQRTQALALLRAAHWQRIASSHDLQKHRDLLMLQV
ncbi:hypothetical protein CEP53_004964 [Fusarium sp. AF-6]|nr:hypothetical protein CEP53_004964 [Fusarium sp. AF-6]